MICQVLLVDRAMQALIYDQFGVALRVAEMPAPRPGPRDVVVRVGASGICRSDWHGWRGNDPDIGTARLPHIPGHEFAGRVIEIGPEVQHWDVGDRVTAPFCCGCGQCVECAIGNTHICSNYSQPGFTDPGSLAEQVVIRNADTNLVPIPEEMSDVTAAALGCRFSTAFHAVINQGNLRAGEWTAVWGCGGLGLSAIMIAKAAGGRVIGLDIKPEQLALAEALGAEHVWPADETGVERILAATDGGADVSLDAIGNATAMHLAISSLRPRGRHVQVGLLSSPSPSPPWGRLIGTELVIKGSHGMPASQYGPMMRMIGSGMLRPDRLIQRRATLEEAPMIFEEMTTFATVGFSVVEFP